MWSIRYNGHGKSVDSRVILCMLQKDFEFLLNNHDSIIGRAQKLSYALMAKSYNHQIRYNYL